MMSSPVDPRFALDSANESDLVQKKLSIDAMRKRVSGGPSKEAKLRESCEGFESIFLQKMWEQMRKNVKKEGYLHSKDEEAYQSMFDVELAKKMASAGGIGLADMLYEQLGQKLHNVSKTTGSAALRKPLPIEPARPPKPVAEPAPAPRTAAPENLYSEVEAAPAEATAAEKTLASALAELAASRDPALDPANATYPMFDLQTGSPLNPVADKMKEASEPKREIVPAPLPERVSPPGRARPSNAIGAANRSSRQARRKARTAVGTEIQPAGQTGAASAAKPADAAKTAWPVRGDVVSAYGRQPDDSWHTGVSIAAAAGSPVTAPLDGVVSRMDEKDGVPHLVLTHEDGLTTHFINVASRVGEGERVRAGMEIAQIPAGREASDAATAGATGQMRFEVRRGELAINPEILLG